MNDDELLRSSLERGDPIGDGREPGREEIARLRQRVLLEAASERPALPRLRWSMAAAAAALVVLLLAERAGQRAAPHAPRVQPTPVRQVHFQTPGGTRLIWVLRPAEGS